MTAAQVRDSGLQVTAGETSASAWEEESFNVRLGKGGGAGTAVGCAAQVKCRGSSRLKCRARL